MRCFGKLPATRDTRDLLFAKYLHPHPLPVLPTPPDLLGHDSLVKGPWGMLANDTVGDCTCAGADHEHMIWSAEAGAVVTFTPEGCLSDYSHITGYVPGDESSDQGANVRDVLRYRRNYGMIDSQGTRHKIGAFVSVALRHDVQLAQALYLLGAVGLGIEVPQSAMHQTDQGKPWDVPPRNSPIVGGHYVPLVARRGGYWWVITWGALQAVTTAFLHKYADEMWAMLTPEMLTSGGVSLEGFNLLALQADLAALSAP